MCTSLMVLADRKGSEYPLSLFSCRLIRGGGGASPRRWCLFSELDYWTDHFTTKIHFQTPYPAISVHNS